jgi:hypothetical protein
MAAMLSFIAVSAALTSNFVFILSRSGVSGGSWGDGRRVLDVLTEPTEHELGAEVCGVEGE